MQPDPRRQHAGPPATEGDLVVSSQPAAEVVLAAVSAEPLSVDAVLAAVRDPRAAKRIRLLSMASASPRLAGSSVHRVW